jgi:hypothetical protein
VERYSKFDPVKRQGSKLQPRTAREYFKRLLGKKVLGRRFFDKREILGRI